LIVGIVQFILLTALAMLLYRGGDAEEEMYFNFWFDALSVLGSVTDPSGGPLGASTILFDASLAILGASLVMYWAYASIKGRKVRSLRRAFGMASSVAIIGTALTPSDVMSVAHATFVYAWLVFFTAAISLELHERPGLVLGIFEVFSIVYIVSVMVSGFVPSFQPVSAFMQKFMVIGILAWYIVRSKDLDAKGFKYKYVF
jgi:hypothetical protein